MRTRSQARILNEKAASEPSFDLENGTRGPRPVPNSVRGVNRWVVDLNGSWRFSTGPAASFHRDDLDSFSWTEVQMPNELEMEGISARSDVEYLLRRTFKVPQDFAGRAIIVRFDGVYSHARVWINGHYVREHHGGFTSWDCEITPYVKAGERAELVILLVDRSDDPSGASEYAKHSIAGILRDVSLLALPPVHVQHLHISASLDDQYLTGLLDIQLRLSQATAGATSVSLSLRDPRGALVPLRFTKPVRTGAALKFEQIRIPHVQRWDAEHPYLHELLVELQVGDASETIKRSIGFRRVERVGNRLFVNGEPVVLRGICRHDIHPTRGRAALLQNDERDPALLRKANINFVRTSHYPPTETFLAACDRVGLYVEEETAVCFSTAAVTNPAFEDRFVRQFSEMLERDHWHPSVILWSLGNESTWGPNFKAELKRVREVDSSRPVIFSWSETLGEDRPLLDVYSSHYPVWDGDLGGNDFPVLHDEFAHVACYNTDDLRRDPGVRNFWGHSLAIFGQKFLNTRGCLGGAIWAGIDEVFLLPNRVTGFGPWGILDGWRREKPEFWLTRKAFSPIRLNDGILPLPQSGQKPTLEIGNGFDHTNLKELTIEWTLGDRQGTIPGPDVPPHGVSQLRIPVTTIGKCQTLKLKFNSPNGVEIDSFELPVSERVLPVFPCEHGELRLRSSADGITISGATFSLSLDARTGLIRDGSINSRTVIEGGPFLNVGHGRPAAWSLAKMEVRELPHSILVKVSGESSYIEKEEVAHGEKGEVVSVENKPSAPPARKVGLQFELEIFGDGRIDLRYRLTGRCEVKIDQLGMTFILPAAIDRLKWRRQALWSVYPDDHIGRPSGTALRASTRSARTSRTRPEWPWSEDMHEPFLYGDQLPPGAATNDFRSLKENVFWAGCFQGESLEHLRVESQGDVAVHASPGPEGRVDLHVYNFWRFLSLSWGNYTGPKLSEEWVLAAWPDSVPAEQKISLRIVHDGVPD